MVECGYKVLRGGTMYIIVGILYIVAGIFGLSYVVKSSDDMLPSVFGLQVDSYKIINKKKFNNLMVLQSVLIAAFFLLMAVFVLAYEKPILIIFAPGMILINIIISPLSKKYITKI